MVVSDAQVKNVLNGNAERKFSQFGFSLLITPLTWTYKNNPTTAVLGVHKRDKRFFVKI